ncbi:IucA/IucC family C-terminal-domain containing protein [Paenibacillus sp. QZ-Y1]|uniref:IucA/IucC family C-terminal-domain containing protein n=1 Tax=Paenibacillus sp. QZ-Y1 TaxID=3414511 RepID=UPI003F79D653
MDSSVIHNWLDEQEMQTLIAEYRLTQEPFGDEGLSMPFTDLLNPSISLPFLERVKDIYETESDTAAVSLFAKRYAYLVIASGLYAMSRFNKGLNVEITNGFMEAIYKGEAWLPKARLKNWQVTSPEAGAREVWRDQIIAQMFAENLAKVWQSLSTATRTSRAVLWENTAIYVYWLYENQFAEAATPEEKSRIEADFHYLLHDAPAHLFGESRNPLKQFNSPKRVTAVSDTSIRVRKTCCFYYLAAEDPDDFCPTCPKLKH